MRRFPAAFTEREKWFHSRRRLFRPVCRDETEALRAGRKRPGEAEGSRDSDVISSARVRLARPGGAG
jgi:hypothetical protein